MCVQNGPNDNECTNHDWSPLPTHNHQWTILSGHFLKTLEPFLTKRTTDGGFQNYQFLKVMNHRLWIIIVWSMIWMIKTRLIVLTIPKSKLANQTTKLFDLNSRILELAPETYKENNELTSITPGLGQIKSGYGNQIARKYAYFSCFNRNLVKLTVRDNFALPQSLCMQYLHLHAHKKIVSVHQKAFDHSYSSVYFAPFPNDDPSSSDSNCIWMKMVSLLRKDRVEIYY